MKGMIVVMFNNVLITGGAGFIGSRVAKKLVESGVNVRVLDNLCEQIHGKDGRLPDFIEGKVDFIKGDVTNCDDWKKALEGMDAVVHLAAQTGTGQSMYEINSYCDVNIGVLQSSLIILPMKSIQSGRLLLQLQEQYTAKECTDAMSMVSYILMIEMKVILQRVILMSNVLYVERQHQ